MEIKKNNAPRFLGFVNCFVWYCNGIFPKRRHSTLEVILMWVDITYWCAVAVFLIALYLTNGVPALIAGVIGFLVGRLLASEW